MENETKLHFDNTNIMVCVYTITPKLRYKMKSIGLKEELRLQQMWQGSDGSEDWQWVEVVE
jgi:hypothetical protein